MANNFSEHTDTTASSDYFLNVQLPKDSFSSTKEKYQENFLTNNKNLNSNKRINKIEQLDRYLSNYIYEMEANIWLERIIYIFARIFNPDLIITFYTLLFLYQSIINKKFLFVLKPLIHVFVIFISTGILKFSFKRPRPEINQKVKRRFNVRKKEKNFSMPSGDSMQAGNFAIIILFYFGFYYGFFIIPFVMFARIFFFCHYLLDTIVGALIGVGISRLLIYPLSLIKI